MDPNMGNDVRLTLIATGFMTKETMQGADQEKELTSILKGIKDDELDMPSFSRRHEGYRTQRTVTGRMN
jgi:cell division protein FtsZ